MTTSIIKPPVTVDTMSLDVLEKKATRVVALLAAIREELPGLLSMSADDRNHSEGRFRDKEENALSSVLDAAEAAPQYFTVLASKDDGDDPKRFETEVLRGRLARRNLLARVAEAIDPLTAEIDDHLLHLGEKVRPVVLAAYHIAKPLSDHDEVLASKLSTARTFYSAIAKRGVETKKKNAAEAAAKKQA
jgi:hypothetical protein